MTPSIVPPGPERSLRGLAVLLLTALLFPAAALLCLPCLLLAPLARALRSRDTRRPVTSPGKCALLLGAARNKALHLGRLLARGGYTVIMADTQDVSFAAASFSTITEAFHYLPRPDADPRGYTAAVLDIVTSRRVTLLVPMDPHTSALDIAVISLLPATCLPLTCPTPVWEELDDKDRFMTALDKCGVRAPRTVRVTSVQTAYDLLRGRSQHYVFKPILYDNVARARIHPPTGDADLLAYLTDSGLCPERPFVIQDKLVGPEVTSTALVVGRTLVAHTMGRSSPVHQTHDHRHCPDIVPWLRDFLRRYPGPLLGFITTDFMRSPRDGRYYPLECNPRLGSAFILFTASDGVVPALEAELASRALDRQEEPHNDKLDPSPMTLDHQCVSNNDKLDQPPGPLDRKHYNGLSNGKLDLCHNASSNATLDQSNDASSNGKLDPRHNAFSIGTLDHSHDAPVNGQSEQLHGASSNGNIHHRVISNGLPSTLTQPGDTTPLSHNKPAQPAATVKTSHEGEHFAEPNQSTTESTKTTPRDRKEFVEPRQRATTPRNGTPTLSTGRKAIQELTQRIETTTATSHVERPFLEPSRRQIYYALNVAWEVVGSVCSGDVGRCWEYVQVALRGQEAVLTREDPLPFLALGFLQMPLLVLRRLLRGNAPPWNVVDYNIGTLKLQ